MSYEGKIRALPYEREGDFAVGQPSLERPEYVHKGGVLLSIHPITGYGDIRSSLEKPAHQMVYVRTR